MGGSTSKLKRWMTGSEEDGVDNNNIERAVKRFATATPFIYIRRSSEFVDEDGDSAHEFYEETRVAGRRGGRGRVTMRRRLEGLVPEGDVVRDIPCLSGDIPVILYQDIPY